MKKATTMIAIAMLVLAGTASAGERGNGHKRHGFGPRHDLFDYARVVDARPIYRRVEVSTPVRECWDEPVYHSDNGHGKSADGMLAGGIIGGIVGHHIARGKNQGVATAVGTLIGAKIGHDAVNRHRGHGEPTVVGYEERCKTSYRVDYEEVVDGYDVTYQYRGQRYQVVMPYDPGKRIKMRIQISPVI